MFRRAGGAREKCSRRHRPSICSQTLTRAAVKLGSLELPISIPEYFVGTAAVLSWAGTPDLSFMADLKFLA